MEEDKVAKYTGNAWIRAQRAKSTTTWRVIKILGITLGVVCVLVIAALAYEMYWLWFVFEGF